MSAKLNNVNCIKGLWMILFSINLDLQQLFFITYCEKLVKFRQNSRYLRRRNYPLNYCA